MFQNVLLVLILSLIWIVVHFFLSKKPILSALPSQQHKIKEIKPRAETQLLEPECTFTQILTPISQ